MLDPVYDEFLALPCGRALSTAIRLSRLRQDHFSFDVKFSYITRQYTCEAFEMWKPQKSAIWYKVPAALGYGAHPLEAQIDAIYKLDKLELTPRIRACILECEVWLLNRAFKQAKQTEDKITKTLDLLAGILLAQPKETTWDEVFADKVKVAGGYRDKLSNDLTILMNHGKPALDEDDDL